MKYVVIKKNKGVFRLLVDSIVYLEKEKNKILIVTENDKHAVYSSFNKIFEIEMANYTEEFIRCHNGFYVNKNKIQSYDGECVRVGGSNYQIPVSRKFKQEIFKAFYS